MSSDDPALSANSNLRAKPLRQPSVIEGEFTEPSAEASTAEAKNAQDSDALGQGSHALPNDTPPRSARRFGLFSGVAALICILGAGAFSYFSWVETRSAQDQSAAMSEDLRKLAERVDAAERASAGAVRLSENGARLPESVSRLTESVAALDKRISAVEARPVATSDAVAALTRRVGAAEAALAGAGAQGQALAALQQRMAGLEADAKSTRTEARSPTPEGSQASIDLAPLDRRISDTATRLDDLEQKISAPKTEMRAPTQEPSAQITQSDDAVGLAVVTQAIERAVARGAGFEPELGVAEKLGADPAKVAILKTVAHDGARTPQMLLAALQGVREQLETPPSKPSVGSADQITNYLGNLVRVRPVGEKRIADASGSTSQIEAALQRGSVAQAIAAWEKLPDAARSKSASWIGDARKTVLAEAAAHDLATSAIAALGRRRSPQ